MTADIFAPYQTVATPDYWALSSTERDGLGAILRLKTYRDLPSRRDLEPQDSDEATLILLEAQSEAQARLDLDSAIRETERAARLEEVWATSRHAVRIGATTIGSTELAQLRQRSLRERMTAVNTRPLPEYTDTPAADTEVAAPGRLRTIATAIGRSVSRLWHKQPTPAGRHRA